MAGGFHVPFVVVGVCGVIIGFIFIFSLPKDLAKDEEKEAKEKERDGERAEDLTLRSVIKVSFFILKCFA